MLQYFAMIVECFATFCNPIRPFAGVECLEPSVANVADVDFPCASSWRSCRSCNKCGQTGVVIRRTVAWWMVK